MLVALITLGVTPSGFVSQYKRDGGLTISLSGPVTNVTTVDDLKFIATVANTGSESVKILKYGKIVDNILPIRSFTVTKDGETVPFTGIKLTVSLEDVDDSAFAVISPGESVIVELSTLFAFASAVPGTLTFMSVTMFKMDGTEAGFANASLDRISVSSSMKANSDSRRDLRWSDEFSEVSL
ncbi:uncharacterized protein EV420DRAFT_1486610 [Desarmillaria tabescens]|uniref:Uncharacterized protein n=1 Tax=Armillaria tabescens TaxID=1929756 RepID=A0AA39J9N3_ARMTA|nr:uncharacterized protein EV420DRAFT_1486610 [Desarmillaria tabescens]KAK0438730.1 hypothetical protein EV420DRAFT_1486610 [Desarmillaria tabescens]